MDTGISSLNPKRHLKEQFVSNLNGTSMLEISLLLTNVSVLLLLRHSCTTYYRPKDDTTSSSKKTDHDDDDTKIISHLLPAYITSFTLDFIFILFPTLLLFTVLADWTYILAPLSTLSLIFLMAAKRCDFASPSVQAEGRYPSFRTNISSYRVATMIITCLCILAVDFHIFPRKYAKTETYGTSLMDLGVGSFVVANSIVSRQARKASSINWKTALRSTCPLILLGFGRLVSTVGVDYQVHVSEYGVHWNFFFTLAGVIILTSVFNVLPQYTGILGSSILIGYQIWLSLGLNVYLLSEERGSDIISQNKEGIFSLLGYWGMYLIGVQLGHYLFFANNDVLRSNKLARTRVWILSLLFWLLTFILDRHVEKVSRRMVGCAALSDVLESVLAIFTLSDNIPGSKTSALEEALDKNLLATFLLANVLTGLVNLLLDTLSASLMSALFILTLYAFTLSTMIGLTDTLNISNYIGYLKNNKRSSCGATLVEPLANDRDICPKNGSCCSHSHSRINLKHKNYKSTLIQNSPQGAVLFGVISPLKNSVKLCLGGG
ncbi:hypothetical protein ACFE04_012067 [Oxalis oulophora]